MQFLLNVTEMAGSVFLLLLLASISIGRWSDSKKEPMRWKFKFYRTLGIFFFCCSIPLTIWSFTFSEEILSHNKIIYDTKSNTVINNLWYHQWLINRFKPEDEKRYLFAARDLEVDDEISDISYVAKLHLDNIDPGTVKKAFTHWRFDFGIYTANTKLSNAIFVCVNSLTKTSFRVEGNPQAAIRGLSINDMNERCPLEPKFGYRWVSLELTLP